MKIWFSSYQLYPKGSLNSLTKTKFRKGAILRVRFDDESVGYADLCPFSEMGDRPLELELKQISNNMPSDLAARSLYFARMDAEARSKKQSLYDPNVRIKNHFLITDIFRFDLDRVSLIEASGYSEFKIKMGRDLPLETQLVEKLSNRFSSSTRIRLDFNASMSREGFTDWFEKNQGWLRSSLEFIEDPFSYDARSWLEVSQKYGIAFALDQAAEPISTGAEGARVIVVKPAVQDHEAIINRFRGSNKKFVFTHYMDFPVGQMCACVAAQKAYLSASDQILSCGLQQHDLYEGFTFQDAIKMDGPYIVPPDGFGLGFDQWLENQSWMVLK